MAKNNCFPNESQDWTPVPSFPNVEIGIPFDDLEKYEIARLAQLSFGMYLTSIGKRIQNRNSQVTKIMFIDKVSRALATDFLNASF